MQLLSTRVVPERRLIVMRHATADFGGGGDALRPLSERGRGEAKRVGQRLRRLGLTPDRVLCSTATRCRETWEGIAKAFEEAIPIGIESALYNASSRRLLEAIAEVEEAKTLIVLAHNPGVSVLTLDLAGGSASPDPRLRQGFAPATFACFAVEGPWSLTSRRSVRLMHYEGPSDA